MWRLASAEHWAPGDGDPLLRAYAEEVLVGLQARGLARGEAQQRFEQDQWWAVLLSAGPAVMAAYTPEQFAEEVLRERRCAICGHPLHMSSEDLRLPIRQRPRLLRHVPHTAACSCGYAQPRLDDRWLAALNRHARAHPTDIIIDAAEPGFLQAVVRQAP